MDPGQEPNLNAKFGTANLLLVWRMALSTSPVSPSIARPYTHVRKAFSSLQLVLSEMSRRTTHKE